MRYAIVPTMSTRSRLALLVLPTLHLLLWIAPVVRIAVVEGSWLPVLLYITPSMPVPLGEPSAVYDLFLSITLSNLVLFAVMIIIDMPVTISLPLVAPRANPLLVFSVFGTAWWLVLSYIGILAIRRVRAYRQNRQHSPAN